VQLRDTIVAISTPPGRSGIGVVRLSGAEARPIASKVLRFSSAYEWKPWTAALAELVDDDAHAIDQVVATFFAAPRSYTAEDLVEISCHGSPVILRFSVERCLEAGVNDLGGTLMNETITRSAGAQHGQEMSPEQMEATIRAAGRVPAQRTTLYGSVTEERRLTSFAAAPLAGVVNTPARRYQRTEAAASTG
jgi:hypothetical protein